MKKILQFLTLFLIFTEVICTFSQAVNNRQRNLLSSASRSSGSRSTSSNRGSGGGGSSSSNSSTSSGGLSTGAAIALYVCVPVGFCLIVTLITIVCRRYNAQKVKKQQEQVQQNLQFNKQNAFQQMCQVNQNIGQSAFYLQGQTNPTNYQQPQQYQFQVYPNQNNQSYF
ncbi:transmembrane protein, putative (macronuclear) [Tetrahymena thermophila SB210]|uniref:Transmembrane protein, putative n=1 Tax=Tetrahymena thermophila (strain SB210) TaxID=312017 RepID=W7XD21_TETTS|nr:transmembrane protein, putative [Tetrahymena thermophila SB210]EWS74503.1 transmembrane protein, putative [Tetrahymena thermophila SB210]|eukprot:XP_012652988.1 transmembrane protein, putative [Tetrahymena thermophila SB210]